MKSVPLTAPPSELKSGTGTMDEQLEDTEGMDRRSMLRKAAMGGALVWATPIVQTLGQGVAAAATQNFVGCPEGGGGTPPKTMTFRWTGNACSASDGDALVSSSGPNLGNVSATVDIVITYGPGANGETVTKLGVPDEGTFTIGDGQPGTQLNPEATFEIYEAGTQNLIRTVVVHTSCSQPLLMGDTYCGLTLIGGF